MTTQGDVGEHTMGGPNAGPRSGQDGTGSGEAPDADSAAGLEWSWLATTMRVAALISGLLFLLMAVVTVYDVVGRATGGRTFPAASTVIPLVTVAAGYISLAHAGQSGAHVSTPVLTSQLRPRAAAVARAAGLLITLLFLGVIVYHTGVRAWEAWQSGEASLGVDRTPVWPARAAIPLGLTGLILVEVRRLLVQVRLVLRPSARHPTEIKGRS